MAGPKPLCVRCRKRPARYRYHGKVKADADHDLCMQCFRAIEDSRRIPNRVFRPLVGKVDVDG